MLCSNCFHELNTDGACPRCGYDPATQAGKYPLALRPGSILNGRYTVGRVLGQGGFGVTYIALDDRTGGRVAIKEYLPTDFAGRAADGTSVQIYSGDREENFAYGKAQFLVEAKTLAEFIGDEHIVRIFSYFEENCTAYFVMEYVDGPALNKYMSANGGRLSVAEAGYLLLPLMDSLDHVHQKGVIHRDVAPDNIIIENGDKAKLIDFGAARYSTGEKSKSLDVILKHGFAPYEQYKRHGRQGPWTDIYAMAATFYYAITGKVPPEAVDRMEEDELVPPAELGVAINGKAEQALDRALAVSASKRYQSMAEFHRDMQEAILAELQAEQHARERAAREEAERKAREEAERLERERRAREEAERLERERIEREKAAREEAERLERERIEKEKAAREEAERLERERIEREKAEREEAKRRAREEKEAREREKREAKERAAREKAERRAEKQAAGGSGKKPLPLILGLAAVLVAALVFVFTRGGRPESPAVTAIPTAAAAETAAPTAEPEAATEPEASVESEEDGNESEFDEYSWWNEPHFADPALAPENPITPFGLLYKHSADTGTGYTGSEISQARSTSWILSEIAQLHISTTAEILGREMGVGYQFLDDVLCSISLGYYDESGDGTPVLKYFGQMSFWGKEPLDCYEYPDAPDDSKEVIQYLEEHASEFYDRGMELRTEGQRNGTWMSGSHSNLQPLSGHMGETETVTGVFEDGVPATIHPFILEEVPESFDTLVVKLRVDRFPSDYPFGSHFFLVRDKEGKWFHITPDFPILPEHGGGQEVYYGFFGSNDLITDEFRRYFPGITAIAGPFPVSGETAAEANFNIEFYAYSYQNS